ncbi:MAG: hypothetical protein WA079_08400 [Leuconostoc falkenbergense]|uniref:hypothetical protein n=1 Tax=Leuconostoc falkenbergense TaxID=2766470 RepID=UPI003BB7A2A9
MSRYIKYYPVVVLAGNIRNQSTVRINITHSQFDSASEALASARTNAHNLFTNHGERMFGLAVVKAVFDTDKGASQYPKYPNDYFVEDASAQITANVQEGILETFRVIFVRPYA